VAPDLPGFGRSDIPSGISFAKIANIIGRFTEIIGLSRFALYIFDYGAPTGLRLALKHPEHVTAVITQNGNAYEEGLSEGWKPIRAYWKEPSKANRDALRTFLSPDTVYWQYTHGVSDVTAVSPDGYSLDDLYLTRTGAYEAQLDLLGDYASNVALYPEFQAYLRKYQLPLLAVWGRNDPIPDFNPLLQMPSGVYLTFFGSFVFGTLGFPFSDVPLQQIAADARRGGSTPSPRGFLASMKFVRLTA
jgi:pimeloyl-ACP methyl ester carboxylesterase